MRGEEEGVGLGEVGNRQPVEVGEVGSIHAGTW